MTGMKLPTLCHRCQVFNSDLAGLPAKEVQSLLFESTLPKWIKASFEIFQKHV
jgi:hypothetical protein